MGNFEQPSPTEFQPPQSGWQLVSRGRLFGIPQSTTNHSHSSGDRRLILPRTAIEVVEHRC
jgi:hypothetical protein